MGNILLYFTLSSEIIAYLKQVNPYNLNTVNICLIMSTVLANKLCLNQIKMVFSQNETI